MPSCSPVVSLAKIGLFATVVCVQSMFGAAASGDTCLDATGASRPGIMICDLGTLVGGASSFARAVSDDGTVIVGVSGSSEGERAFLWTEADGMVNLGTLPGGSKSQARDVSSDGKVIVGSSDTYLGQRAFVWTKKTGMIGIGDPKQQIPSSASAVNADGSVVVGFTGSSNNRSAFYWTAETGMKPIGTEAFANNSAALGVSGDGSVVVGRVGFRAFRWTQEQGIVLLASENSSVAFDVSEEGQRIVGAVGPVYSKRRAAEWLDTQRFEDVNPTLNGLRSTALDISDDGLYVSGAINRRAAFIRKRGKEATVLGGLPKRETDFASDKASGSGAKGSVVVGTSIGVDGNRAVRWLLSEEGAPD